MGICVSNKQSKHFLDYLIGDKLIIYIREKCKKYKVKKNNIKFNYYMNLILNLNYKDIDEKCCVEFQNSNFIELFENDYKDFIQKLFENINLNDDLLITKMDDKNIYLKVLKNINKILELFKKQSDFVNDKIACDEFQNVISKNNIIFSQMNLKELENFLINALNFLIKNESKENTFTFLQLITKSNINLFNDYINFYLDLINNKKIKNIIKQYISFFLIKQSMIDDKLDFLIIQALEKIDYLNYFFFDVLNDQITININDFYIENNSFSILLFYKIYNFGKNVKEKIKKINLFENNEKKIQKLYNDVMQCELKFFELEKIHNLILNNLYKERMYLLCNGKKDLINNFEKKVNEDYENFVKIKNEYKTNLN